MNADTSMNRDIRALRRALQREHIGISKEEAERLAEQQLRAAPDVSCNKVVEKSKKKIKKQRPTTKKSLPNDCELQFDEKTAAVSEEKAAFCKSRCAGHAIVEELNREVVTDSKVEQITLMPVPSTAFFSDGDDVCDVLAEEAQDLPEEVDLQSIFHEECIPSMTNTKTSEVVSTVPSAIRQGEETAAERRIIRQGEEGFGELLNQENEQEETCSSSFTGKPTPIPSQMISSLEIGDTAHTLLVNVLGTTATCFLNTFTTGSHSDYQAIRETTAISEEKMIALKELNVSIAKSATFRNTLIFGSGAAIKMGLHLYHEIQHHGFNYALVLLNALLKCESSVIYNTVGVVGFCALCHYDRSRAWPVALTFAISKECYNSFFVGCILGHIAAFLIAMIRQSRISQAFAIGSILSDDGKARVEKGALESLPEFTSRLFMLLSAFIVFVYCAEILPMVTDEQKMD